MVISRFAVGSLSGDRTSDRDELHFHRESAWRSILARATHVLRRIDRFVACSYKDRVQRNRIRCVLFLRVLSFGLAHVGSSKRRRVTRRRRVRNCTRRELVEERGVVTTGLDVLENFGRRRAGRSPA